jgi:hypothetical protein
VTLVWLETQPLNTKAISAHPNHRRTATLMAP